MENKLRRVLVDEGEPICGWFHCWCGLLETAYGIVELTDGKLRIFKYNKIRFVDRADGRVDVESNKEE